MTGGLIFAIIKPAMKQILLAVLALILVLIFGFATAGFDVFTKNHSIASIGITSASSKKTNLNLLGSQKDLSLFPEGIKWDPDGHISYVTFPNGNRRFFIEGNQSAYVIDTPTPVTLAQALSKNPSIKKVFGPDPGISYRNNYATIASVVQTDPQNLYHLFAFTQYEQQAEGADGTYDYSTFTASIGLLESKDGGNTWKDYGPVIRGDDYIDPGTKISGAGEPCAIIVNGYVYVYFVDWAAGNKISHPDAIYLARTKIFPDGGLGAFKYYTTSGFNTSPSNLVPVISMPNFANADYASLPSISYNKYLDQYFAVFETNVGFVQATSIDGINWTNEKLFYSFAQPQSDRQTGDTWVSYPTLLSDQSETSDGSTQGSGTLYFAKGIWPNTAHQLTAISFQFK